MVGGVIVEVLDQQSKGRVWINVQGTGCEKNDFCAIYVKRTDPALRVAKGDFLWWQGRKAFHTPKQFVGRTEEEKDGYYGIRHDINLERIGYSGVRHPAESLIEGDSA